MAASGGDGRANCQSRTSAAGATRAAPRHRASRTQASPPRRRSQTARGEQRADFGGRGKPAQRQHRGDTQPERDAVERTIPAMSPASSPGGVEAVPHGATGQQRQPHGMAEGVADEAGERAAAPAAACRCGARPAGRRGRGGVAQGGRPRRHADARGSGPSTAAATSAKRGELTVDGPRSREEQAPGWHGGQGKARHERSGGSPADGPSGLPVLPAGRQCQHAHHSTGRSVHWMARRRSYRFRPADLRVRKAHGSRP